MTSLRIVADSLTGETEACVSHSHSISWKEMQYLFPKLDFDWIKGGLV